MGNYTAEQHMALFGGLPERGDCAPDPDAIREHGPHHGARAYEDVLGKPAKHARSDTFWLVDEETGCWEWQLKRDHKGYGEIGRNGRSYRAHRWVYEKLRGEIPEGLICDHLCRNRGCVNPDHLEFVTNRENVLRGDGPTAANAAKTHCVHGHEFTPENTYRTLGGGRDCRECKRIAYASKSETPAGGGIPSRGPSAGNSLKRFQRTGMSCDNCGAAEDQSCQPWCKGEQIS